VVILLLFLVAMIGPWVFDRINVPAAYACDSPHVRLEGDFCGLPLPGAWVVLSVFGAVVRIVAGLVSGTMDLALRGRELLPGLLLVLPLLPAFSTLLLIIRGDRGRWPVWHLAPWGLALIAGGWLLLFSSPMSGALIHQWGLLLYVLLAVGALLLETSALIGAKRRLADAGRED
jgi:hypothetical protein